MKSIKISVFIAFLYISTILNAQYQLDTISVKQVSDGVKHFYLVEHNIPWNINVMTVDLTNPHLTIETSHAGDNIMGHAGTTTQAKSNSFEGHDVVGAINADFFDGDGITTGHQVINGELLRSIQARDWSKIAFDENYKPSIQRYNFSGTVFIDDGSTTLDGVNVTRGENKIVLFNSYIGSSTGQNQWGSEALLKPVNQWLINDTVKCVVEKLEQRIGDMDIEEGRVVLSAHGTKEDLLTPLSLGDTISIAVNLTPGDTKLRELVSGFPQIVKDGTNYALEGYANEGGGATFATDRHPRTGIGFNADSTTLYLFVVDGRQDLSKGVSLIELANIMIQMGVHDGLNLDGGGSSTMEVKDDIVNYPSDGSERIVGNALLVVSSEPVVIEDVALYPDTVVTNLEKTIQFWYDAFDKYGYNHEYNFEEAFVTVSNSNIGTINSRGLFTPAENGITDITAGIDNGTGLSKVSVETYEGEHVISSLDDISSWELSSEEIDTTSFISVVDNPVTEGSGAIQLKYNFTYNSGNFYRAYINTDIPIDGVPESIIIDALGDEYNHTLAFTISDENDEEFIIVCSSKLNNSDSYKEYTASFNNPIKLSNTSKFYFPVRLKQIAIDLVGSKINGTEYNGTLTVDNLRIKYPEPVSVDDETLPDEFRLYQNYPNPFNPSTTIEYSIPTNVADEIFSSTTNIKLILYDILGREVAVLVNEYQQPGNYRVVVGTNITDRLSSGVYFYKLTAGNFTATKKLLLIK